MSNVNDKILQDIQNGKYADYYLEYNRKSTDEAEHQKNSIEFQKTENARFAQRKGLKLASLTIKGFCADGIVSEKHSGFKEDDLFSFSDEGMVQLTIN